MSDHHHGDDAAQAHGHGHEGLWAGLTGVFKPHSHDAGDSIDSALEASEQGIRAVKISLVLLMLTALAQLVVVWFSGSVALLADTIHNFSDALTALPLWFAFVLGRRAATKRFNYGYGRAEDLAGLFVVAMIALSTVVAAWQALDRLFNPREVDHVLWVGIAGLVGFAGNEVVAVYRMRVGRRIGSAALVADGYHARTDGFTSLAVVLGAVGVSLGWRWADPVVGLLIAVAIASVLVAAARDVLRRLLDAVDPALVDRAEAALKAHPDVQSVTRVRLRWIGHELHADAELTIDPALTLTAAHRLAHDAEHRLTHAVPRLSAAVVHAYPAHAAVDPVPLGASEPAVDAALGGGHGHGHGHER